MTHAITMTNNVAEMAFLGKTPWHGLGQQLQQGATIETWQEAAGMDWKVQRSKVRYFCDHEGTTQLEWPDKHILFRSDTHAPLGVVSDNYKIVQPGQVLEFFRDLCETNDFTLETAGTLHGGKKFWALANIGESANIIGRDQVNGYLLLSTSADGSMATVGKCTAIRVVCQNTMSMALHTKDVNEIKISHRSRFDADTAKQNLGIVRGQFSKYVEAAQELAQINVSVPRSAQFVGELLNDVEQDRGADVVDARSFKRVMEMIQTAQRNTLMQGIAGTAWGLVNTVTEYVDHRSGARTVDNRLDRAWYGKGDQMKSAAMEKAVNEFAMAA